MSAKWPTFLGTNRWTVEGVSNMWEAVTYYGKVVITTNLHTNYSLHNKCMCVCVCQSFGIEPKILIDSILIALQIHITNTIPFHQNLDSIPPFQLLQVALWIPLQFHVILYHYTPEQKMNYFNEFNPNRIQHSRTIP